MKRMFALILTMAMLLSMAACGGEAAPQKKSVDLNAVYEGYQAMLPDMFLMDADTMLNFLGIEAADCVQAIAAVSGDGLRADEVWLIEAKDQAALERIENLAKTRLVAKEDETVSYNPEQYQVVIKAELITEGMYLALLVSPEVETMKIQFADALK